MGVWRGRFRLEAIGGGEDENLHVLKGGGGVD